MTLTNVDILLLTAGQSYTLTAAQAQISKVGAGDVGSLVGAIVTVKDIAASLAPGGNIIGSLSGSSAAVIITDQPSVAELIAINNATGGIITLQTTSGALNGTASDLDAAFAGSINEYTGDLTITNSASISELTNIDAATSGTVSYIALSDTADALVPSGTISSYVTSNHTVTIEDQASVSQLIAINAATAGAITLNVTSGSLTGTAAELTSAFNGTITEYTGNLTATGSSANLSQAEVIFNATSGTSTYAVADFANTLGVAPSSATQMAALKNASSVTANASALQATLDMSGFSGDNTVDLIINGNSFGNTITGGDGNDTINAVGAGDTIYGGLGDDKISSGDGSDIHVFSTTLSLNGADTVTDFNVATDTVLFLFGGTGELANNAVLRGDGTEYLEVASSGALGTNSGVVIITDTQSDLTASTARTLAEGLTGETADDIFYLVFDNGSDTALYRVADTNSDATSFETVELIVTLEGITDADDILDSSVFTDF